MKPIKAKLIAGTLAVLCLAALGFYATKGYTADKAWKQVRQQRIVASPKVYLTRTGKKYHQAYHYSGRNYETSLYEATEQHYDACMVCRPPGHEELLPPLVWYYDYWILLTVIGAFGSLFAAGLVYGKLSNPTISN
jgi:hypothetical protein